MLSRPVLHFTVLPLLIGSCGLGGAAPAPPKLELICRTNKSVYIVGEPIYVSVGVKVLAGSPPLSSAWLLPGKDFWHNVIGGGVHVFHLFRGYEPGLVHHADSEPFDLQPGECLSTSFEALFAQDFQSRRATFPSLHDDQAYEALFRQGELFLKWGHFRPSRAQFPYQVEVRHFYHDRTERDLHDRVMVKGVSNRFWVVENPEPTPEVLFHFLEAIRFNIPRNGAPWVDRVHVCEKLLKEGKLAPQFRAWGMHTIMQTHRAMRRFRDAATWGSRILDAYPGYPLQPEVEFDMAVAYIALQEKDKAESIMRGMVERLEPTRVVHPAIRRFKQLPAEYKEADALYRKLAADLGKAGKVLLPPPKPHE